MQRRFLNLVLALALLLTVLPAGVAGAAPLDYDIPNGHFFQQANGQGGAGNTGFAVTNNDNVLFWNAFNRLGGVNAVGYPVSHRFQWKGFTVQAFQKVVFQWRPESGQVMFVNLFDEMSSSGKDDWLVAVRMTPKSLDWAADGGQAWGQVSSNHLAVLDQYPAIKASYYAQAGDPITMNGLPMSVQDMGNAYVVRAQRKVFQQWKVAVPWAAAGQVTVSNGGDIGKEAGLYPADAITPRAWGQPAPAPCAAPAITGFTVSPATITQGQQATLSWGAVNNATDVSIDNGIGGVATPGSRTVSPSGTITYTMRAVGHCGTTTATATLHVNAPQPQPVPQVQLASPGNNASGTLPVRLTWNNASTGGKTYTYSIDVDRNYGGLWSEYIVQHNITGTSIEVPIITDGISQAIRWRVWATDPATGASGPVSSEWTYNFEVLPQ